MVVCIYKLNIYLQLVFSTVHTTRDGRTTWIAQRNEINDRFYKTNRKNNSFFYWTNEFFKRIWQKLSFFTKRTIFLKAIGVLLNKRFFSTNFWNNDSFFYWTKNFTEQTILLNEWFYWKIVHWEKGRNRWKLNDTFKNE